MGRVDARPPHRGVYMTPCVRAIQASTGLVHRVTTVAAIPPGEWLGSEADEGRAKLRKA
jgi:hypothetical protein